MMFSRKKNLHHLDIMPSEIEGNALILSRCFTFLHKDLHYVVEFILLKNIWILK